MKQPQIRATTELILRALENRVKNLEITARGGTSGADGVDGNTILYGHGAPAPGLGVDGNFYLDQDGPTLYGPRVAGTWPAGVTLSGPIGPIGPTGPAGSAADINAEAAARFYADASELARAEAAEADRYKRLAMTATATADVSLGNDSYTPADTTTGAITATLPASPEDRTLVGIGHVRGADPVTYQVPPSNVGTPVSVLPGGGYATSVDVADPAYGHTAGLTIGSSDLAGFFVKLDGTPFKIVDQGMNVPPWALNVNSVAFDNRHPNQAIGYGCNTAQAMLVRIVIDVSNLTAVCIPVVSNVALVTSHALYLNSTLAGAKTGGSPQTTRRTGRKLVADLFTDGRAYVGTDFGVQVWDGGSNVANLVLNTTPATQVTSLVWGPESTTTNVVLYATTVGNSPGVWKITGCQPGGTPVATALSGTTGYTTLRGVAAVTELGATVVYFTDSGTTRGIFKHDGTTKTLIGNGYSTGFGAGPIDALRNAADTATTLYSAHFYAGGSSTGRLVWSFDSGTTWTELATSNVHTTIGGPSGPVWWLATRTGEVLSARSAGAGAAYNCVKIRPDQPSTVVISGHAGYYITPNSGADWYPYVDGAALSVGNQVIAHPSDSTKRILIDEDWIAIRSTSAGPLAMTTTGNGGQCGVIASDLSLIYAQSDRDTNAFNKVYRHADPWNATDATAQTRVDISANLTGDRVIGLAARDIGGHTWLLAVQQNSGVWVKDATALGWAGNWTRILTKSFNGTNLSRLWSSVRWVDDDTIYVTAPDDFGTGGTGGSGTVGGLWRCTTFTTTPTTWTRVAPFAPNARYTQNIAVLAATPTTVVVAVDTASSTPPSGVYKLTNANNGTLTAGVGGFTNASGTVAATRIHNATDPGPVAYDQTTGRLYVTTVASDATYGARIYGAIAPAVQADFADWTSNGWASAVLYPQHIAIDNGHALAANANGSHWAWDTAPSSTFDDATGPVSGILNPTGSLLAQYDLARNVWQRLASHGPGRIAQEVVVASDAPSWWPTLSGARVCDGVDDDVQLQAAIDALTAAGGGELVVSPGTFTPKANSSGNLRYGIALKDGVTISCPISRGATIKWKTNAITGSTVAQATADAGLVITSSKLSGGPASNARIGLKSVVIDANAANQGSGSEDVFCAASMWKVDGLIMEDVVLKNARGTGGLTGSGLYEKWNAQLFRCRNIVARDVEVMSDNPGVYGATGIGAQYCDGGVFEACYGHDNRNHGLNNHESSNLRYTDCHSYDNLGSGYLCERGRAISYEGCTSGSVSNQISTTWWGTVGTSLGNALYGWNFDGGEFIRVSNCLSMGNGINGWNFTNGTDGEGGLDNTKTCGSLVNVYSVNNGDKGFNFTNDTGTKWRMVNPYAIGNTTADIQISSLETGRKQWTFSTPRVGVIPANRVPLLGAGNALAASTTWTNQFPWNLMVTISGGTGVAITIDGVSTGASSGTFLVPAASTLNLGAYTVNPTLYMVASS